MVPRPPQPTPLPGLSSCLLSGRPPGPGPASSHSPAEVSKECRLPGHFLPSSFCGPTSSPLPAPTPSRFPLKCLQACLQAGSPLPHRTTSVTALTTGRSGLDLLKDPGGGACPSLAAWLADGVGFRPVALERERERQRAKSRSPPPPSSPRRVSPPPSGPARARARSPRAPLAGWDRLGLDGMLRGSGSGGRTF